MHEWDSGQYLRFADERTQPALDLLARIRLERPRRLIDLGCGPGNSTILLKRRWPEAAIAGLDTSAAMLDVARRDHQGIEFVQGDIAAWRPEKNYDVVFSNAALQWVGDHPALFPRLLEGVAPDGVLAVQMPRNHDLPAHVAMRRVVAEGPWRDRLAGARGLSPVHAPEFYYDLMAPLAARLVMWETNYVQPVDDVAAIIGWMRGTGLRPFLERLDASEQPAFLEHYAAALTPAFPRRADGKLLLNYPRLFLIATPR